MEHDILVAQQFGPTAQAYLKSVTHASGEDLRLLAEEISATSGGSVLDLGCGAGHASFAVAPYATSVTAYDLTDEMLAVVRHEARTRGIDNISTVQGMAEKLPFPAEQFDWVISRFSAHHWHDVPAALGEIARVLKPQGQVALIDTAGSETPLLDTHLQTVEILRDPSHIRDYSAQEWLGFFREAGFKPAIRRSWPLVIEFSGWIERMRTPPERVTAIRSIWKSAPDEVRRSFNVQPDGSFTIEKIWIAAGR
jgi:SAM-dependent methyltransferase